MNTEVSSFLRSAWECNCASKGYHAERGSQVSQVSQVKKTGAKHPE